MVILYILQSNPFNHRIGLNFILCKNDLKYFFKGSPRNCPLQLMFFFFIKFFTVANSSPAKNKLYQSMTLQYQISENYIIAKCKKTFFKRKVLTVLFHSLLFIIFLGYHFHNNTRHYLVKRYFLKEFVLQDIPINSHTVWNLYLTKFLNRFLQSSSNIMKDKNHYFLCVLHSSPLK